jgi:hypothetical protein
VLLRGQLLFPRILSIVFERANITTSIFQILAISVQSTLFASILATHTLRVPPIPAILFASQPRCVFWLTACFFLAVLILDVFALIAVALLIRLAFTHAFVEQSLEVAVCERFHFCKFVHCCLGIVKTQGG